MQVIADSAIADTSEASHERLISARAARRRPIVQRVEALGADR